jgi:hypothetical protein
MTTRDATAGPDRRWVYGVLAVLVLVPLLVPLGLPITPAPPSRAYHDAIASLPRGATVMVACDFDPSTVPELAPMLRATLDQLFERGCRVVVLTLWNGAPPLVDAIVRDAATRHPAARDGSEYVHLGYQAGNEAVMLRLADGIAAAYPYDFAERETRRLPIAESMRAWSDVALLVSLSAGYPGTKEWVLQVATRFNVPTVAGVTAGLAPDVYPYLESGQLRGLLAGMTGAAEYERLRGERAAASRGMDAQSLAHGFVALCLVLGLFGARRAGGTRA